jgi:CheY-like chemotaxis protein
MNDIIDWLINIEQLAGKTYTRAALYFNEDTDLKTFLEKIAEDEAWHFHIMGSAAENLKKLPISDYAVSIDMETDQKIKGLFQELSIKMDSGTLTKEELFDSVITAEFSEWNDLFLYVVNTLKNIITEFSYIASRIQIHKRSIELYFETRQESAGKISSYKKLKPLWEERILIVDDEDAISGFLEALLEDEGKVDKASNGSEALELVKQNYYRLIISDIDMPEMDGISFYNEAAKIYPDINERIVFFTGGLSEERETFFRDNSLSFMLKPSGISTIRDKVMPILINKDYLKRKEKLRLNCS